MASYITSAGSASGINFESIISASLELKRAQLDKQTTVKKESANLELTGVGKLKDALSSFQKSIKDLTSAEGFNTRKVTTSQTGDNPYFVVTAKDDASNGSYDIAVKQLASTEKVSQSFSKDETLEAGVLQLKVQVGSTGDDGKVTYKEETIDLNIEEGTTISQLRRMINDKAGDFGVNASIVETTDQDGNTQQKLTIDSGISGSDASTVSNRFSMSFSPVDANNSTVGSKLNYAGSSGLIADADGKYQQGSWNVNLGKDAVISVDGETVVSSTNNFDNKISGLNLTVNRVTADPNKEGEFMTFQVNVSQDNDAITGKVQNFLNSYNSLMDTMNSLSKRNTYTDGKNNLDGGELSGDSQLQTLQRQLQSMMTSISGNGIDAYSLGIKLDSNGKFSLDGNKFKDGIEGNFNAVVNMFSAVDDPKTSANESGIVNKLDSVLNEFTKSNGLLDKRSQDLQRTVSYYEDKEAENKLFLEKYEENLRAKYATLDTTIANYNNSMFYLQSVLL